MLRTRSEEFSALNLPLTSDRFWSMADAGVPVTEFATALLSLGHWTQ